MDGLEKRPSGGFDRAHNAKPKKSGFADVLKKVGSAIAGVARWFMKTRWAQVIVLIAILIASGFGLYKFGYARGEQAQKTAYEKNSPKLSARSTSGNATPRPSNALSSHLGEVTEVSATGITVKTSDDKTHKVEFGDNLVVTDAKGAKIDKSAIKKGSKVSTTGTMKDDVMSASRIRIRN